MSKKIPRQTDNLPQRLKGNSNPPGETNWALPLGQDIDVSKLNFDIHPPEAELAWNGEKSVWEAAAEGDLQSVLSFLVNGVNVDVRNDEDCTPLISAALHGQNEIVAHLLAKGAEINTQDVSGRTALMAAVEGGYLETVGLLIARGADINAESDMFPGETALTTAVRRGNAKIIDILKEAGALK